MKFSLYSLAFLASTAVAFNTEVDDIKARMSIKPRKALGGVCNKELDAGMLISRYNMNTSDPTHLLALSAALNGHLQLGSITQNIAEANDAGRTGYYVIDGVSGDENFPNGQIKPLYTVGEINHCEENMGDVYVGVPDGMGSYLVDDDTLRIVVQSESYGPLYYESYPYYVNGDSATFTGSHVQYTDFDRKGLAEFMTHDGAASEIITGFGQVATTYYNLAGELVGPRDGSNPTTSGAHFSNTDKDGNWALSSYPTEADWLMQSLCSSHLEEKHQWGKGIGLEDDMYITNEEWITYAPGAEFVGISAHVMDLANKVDYAVGSVTVSGWEKIVEINPKHPDYVVLAISGYNGAYNNGDAETDARNAEYGPRDDGKDYVNPKNICPARIYIGMKGKMEDGSDAPADDFLARNGLRYGKVYGFAVDMSPDGPTEGLFRDDFHKPRDNGAKVEGKFVAINWQWDGEVKNFRHDGAFDFQLKVPGYEDTDMRWWNANGYDEDGSKTEHLSPDTRPGESAFVQGSTAGYFGHYYIKGLAKKLDGKKDFPDKLDAEYYVYQGEQDISAQINLNGEGLYTEVTECAGASDASMTCDNDFSVKDTFEDIDGFEIIAAKEGLFAIIQEDSGSELGERMFITSVLEHEDDGNELEYNFMAMSGGKYNSRMDGLVGIPAGTSDGGGSHEFSGIIDLSGMLAKKKNGKRFKIKAGDGAGKRKAELKVPINEKLIALGLQAHNMHTGIIEAFKADRGGQVMLYQPDISI